jgi:hypothetical protein
MKQKTIFYILTVVVVIIIVWIGKDTFSQPTVGDLSGEYAEMAKYRNENNTGPVIRVYAVHTSDTLWNEMEEYGNFMPHTKYGNTKVFFFSDAEQTPSEVQPSEPHFERALEPYCIAVYEKSAMGEVSFRRQPFSGQ